ncbi:MAG: ribosome biogenesis GTPase Der [Vicinamibacterales bacterium]
MPGQRRAQVVIVGRPNVGKSTLFNRLTGARRAIVTPVPGTTRDVITHPADWRGCRFDLTDTGGLFGASEDPLHRLVVERGRRALESADLIVFVTDGRDGLVPGDEEIAAAVRGSGVPAVMAINKVDDRRARDGALELYRLGFEPVIEISAEHGRGAGDLLDAVIEKLQHKATERREGAEDIAPDELASRETAIAIVGRPNAGKSSLVNALLREERMIVSPVPGTTRDAVDSVLTWHRRRFRIVDTAGIRKPGRVARSGQVEALSVMLARRAIERADIVVLVMDATIGPTDQDAAIVGAAAEAGRGVIIVANKWDLMKAQGSEGAKIFDRKVGDHLKFLDYAPILHVSAETGERTGKLLETVDRVMAASRARVPTGELNRFIHELTTASPPIAESKRRHVRVLYAAQPTVAPPTFVLFTNVSAKLHFSYMRFLENRLREKYDFFGTPIRIVVRGRASRSAEKRPNSSERRRRTPRTKRQGTRRDR